MFAVLSYLLQVNLALVLLFLAYRCLCVFTTFLRMRRVSLWMVRAGALLFPFVHVSQKEFLLTSDMIGQLGTWTQAAVAFSPNMIQKGIEVVAVKGWWDYALVVYLTIAVLLLGYFVVQWVSLISLYRKSRLEYWVDGTRLHILPGQGASFSFFIVFFCTSRSWKKKSWLVWLHTRRPMCVEGIRQISCRDSYWLFFVGSTPWLGCYRVKQSG